MANRKNSELVQELVKRLVKQGHHEQDAKKIAKSLVTVVRKKMQEELLSNELKFSENEPASVTESSLPKAVPGQAIPVNGAVSAEIMQRMMGISTGASYVVLAVRGDVGIIGVRKEGDYFKVKFYPSLSYWNLPLPRMEAFGVSNHKHRIQYDRLFFTPEGFQYLNDWLIQESAGKSRIKDLLKRFKVAIVDDVLKVLSTSNEEV